ncbi:hypothetical protein PG984_010579 [Apiospora sp. TS-2023a]
MDPTVAKNSEGAPSQIDLESLRLKRELVADDTKGHSCERCKQIRIPPPPLSRDEIAECGRFLQIDTSRTKIQSLANSGCNFWTMIQDQLTYIDLELRITFDSRYIGPYQLACDAGWSEEHYKDLAVTVGDSDAEEFWRLRRNRAESWGLVMLDGEIHPVSQQDLVRVSMEYSSTMNFGDEPVIVKVRLALPIPAMKAAFILDMEAPKSPKAIELAKQWIRQCEVEHKCGINDLPQTLPSMVLDVSDQHKVKLIRAPTKIERYITLSYCWGKTSQAVMLNKKSMSDLTSGISPHQLDATIRDSIGITRELGFRFLWIDALCIPQDNSEFKAKELGKMGSIYRNATFTIVASAAKDVRAGFLGRRVTTIDGVAPADGQPHRVFKMDSVMKETETSTENLPVILVPPTSIVTEPCEGVRFDLGGPNFAERRLRDIGLQSGSQNVK